jgi:hypothetical protein
MKRLDSFDGLDGLDGMALKALLFSGALAALAGLGLVGLFRPPPIAGTLAVFSAPNRIPLGESWVFVGAREPLPQDLAAVAAQDVVVLETQRLSARALAVRLRVDAVVPGSLFGLSSALTGQSADSGVVLGASAQKMVLETSFKESDLVDGALPVQGDHFVYGFDEDPARPLAALRIHNRSLGLWAAQDYAEARAQRALEGTLVVTDPAFVEVDVLETLPDTDGDGVFDFEEEPEARVPERRQLSVELKREELNLLDVLTIDEAGESRWELIAVLAY